MIIDSPHRQISSCAAQDGMSGSKIRMAETV